MTQEPTIHCPKCGSEIPLTEAISHQVRDQVSREFEEKRQAQNKALSEREAKLRKDASDLETRCQQIQSEINIKVQAQKVALAADAERKAREGSALELQDLRIQLKEQQDRLVKAQAAVSAVSQWGHIHILDCSKSMGSHPYFGQTAF